jgi:hypothetical protein
MFKPHFASYYVSVFLHQQYPLSPLTEEFAAVRPSHSATSIGMYFACAEGGEERAELLNAELESVF